jgi:hypothetical protein
VYEFGNNKSKNKLANMNIKMNFINFFGELSQDILFSKQKKKERKKERKRERK